jgi:hypothetical protein
MPVIEVREDVAAALPPVPAEPKTPADPKRDDGKERCLA